MLILLQCQVQSGIGMEKLKAYDPKKTILVCLPPQRAEGNENQEKPTL